MPNATRNRPGRPPAPEQAAKVADVALELFLEHGYDATPMSLVATHCGLTKAGIYHHFESKEELLYYLHKRHIDCLLLPMLDAADQIADPEQRLRSFLGDYATLLTRDPSLRLLINETKRLARRRATSRK
jgi:AcrR family transcriptional regulator